MKAGAPDISRYGNRAIVWDTAGLQGLLTDLRDERQRHDSQIESEISEGRHDELLRQAERIRQRVTNEIAETESQQA